MKQKHMDALEKCALFKNIDRQQLELMIKCINPRIISYKKNEYITIMGDKFTGVGIVLDGEVMLAKENIEGNRIIIDVVEPAEIFGEMVAFAQEKVWPVTAIAQSQSVVMFVPPDKIVGECPKLCVSHRLLIINLLTVLSNKAINLNRKVEYLAMKSLRAKLSRFLLEQYKKAGKPMFVMPLNRNELSDFLNVSRPSLSREMCRMRDEGIIDFHRSSIRIKDERALIKALEL
mgnify:CR=1 FL=1